MNKPDILPMLPGLPAAKLPACPVPWCSRRFLIDAATSRAAIPATRPAPQVDTAAYVDPYLFETGYYASPAEQQELTRTAASRI